MTDSKSAKIYGDQAIIIPEDKRQDIIKFYNNAWSESDDWFNRNYRQDFIRYQANYLSIPGDNVYSPWAEANNYYLPSTNVTIENYVAREVETIKGAKEFVSALPRGKDDVLKAKAGENILRYYWENPMKGYQKAVNVFRNKDIYGTVIATMPWAYEVYKVQIPGIYLWDLNEGKYVTEVRDLKEGEKDIPPMDFIGVPDLNPILSSNLNLRRRKLFETRVVKDHSDLQLHDILNVRVDPNGGTDIQKHRYTIFQSIEDRDTLKRKAFNGEYDKDVVEEILNLFNPKRTLSESEINESISERDTVESKRNDIGKRGGIKIWTCYGKHIVDFSGDEDNLDIFEEETITIIAENTFILRMVITPFTRKGVPYRPILVDRFIELSNRFYGVGIAQILEPLNFVLNHLINQILNQGDLYNAAPLIYPSDSDFDPQFVSYGPGQTWASDNPDGFRLLPVPDIKPIQMQLVLFFQGFIQQTLGINDFTLGGGEGGIVKNQTARGISSILREVNRRIDFYSSGSHENFFKNMFEMMLWQLEAFMSPEELPRITDSSEKEVDIVNLFGADLDIDADIKIRSDLLTATRQEQRSEFKELLQIALNSKDESTGKFILDIVEIVDQLAQTYPNIVNPESLINPQVRQQRDRMKQQEPAQEPAQEQSYPQNENTGANANIPSGEMK